MALIASLAEAAGEAPPDAGEQTQGETQMVIIRPFDALHSQSHQVRNKNVLTKPFDVDEWKCTCMDATVDGCAAVGSQID